MERNQIKANAYEAPEMCVITLLPEGSMLQSSSVGTGTENMDSEFLEW